MADKKGEGSSKESKMGGLLQRAPSWGTIKVKVGIKVSCWKYVKPVH
jgi:hypothetical protein